MKTPKTAFAVGFLDDDLIKSAEKCGNQKKKSNLTIKWASLAACFVLVIGVLTVTLPFSRDEGDASESTLKEDAVSNTNGNTNISTDRYKEYVYSSTEEMREWPWEQLSVFEKYQTIVFNGSKFYGKTYGWF